MSAAERNKLINKLYKVAKSKYDPVIPPSDRPVLEHIMYACCLEDSAFEAADQSMARLLENYFDWNEVRVTTNVELAEVMNALHDPGEAAWRLKRTLHNLFETYYSFDLDSMRKENLGKAVQSLEKLKNTTPFVVAYTSQNALGGHSIPIDRAMSNLFFAIGLMSEKEMAAGKVTGLERAIAKNKGQEFFSVVHQLAAAYMAKPFSNDIRKIITSISASAKDRFPKRKTKADETAKPAAAGKTKKAAAAKKTAPKAEAKTAPVKTAKKKAAATKSSKPVAAKKPAAAKKTAASKQSKTTKKVAKKAAKTSKAAARSTKKKSAARKSASPRKPR